MNFFDDFKTRAEQSFNTVTSDIKTYLENRLTDAVVKVGEPPKGNLTAVDLANGHTGQPVLAPSVAAPTLPLQAQLQRYLPIIAVAGLAYFFFKSKGK